MLKSSFKRYFSKRMLKLPAFVESKRGESFRSMLSLNKMVDLTCDAGWLGSLIFSER